MLSCSETGSFPAIGRVRKPHLIYYFLLFTAHRFNELATLSIGNPHQKYLHNNKKCFLE